MMKYYEFLLKFYSYGILVIPTTILNLECSCTVCDDWVALRYFLCNHQKTMIFHILGVFLWVWKLDTLYMLSVLRAPTESWTIRGTQFRPKFDSFRIGFCRTPDFDWVHMNRSKSIIFPLFFIMIETDGQSSREKVISNRNRHILKSQVYLPGLVTNLIGISPDSVEPTNQRPQTLCGLIDHQELMRTS